MPRIARKKIICWGLLGFFTCLAANFVSAQNAIDFALPDLDGRTVRLKDYIGKNIIVVNFWATWCVPCIKELPHFQKLHDTYEEQGLKVFAITIDGPESIALVKPFVKRYKYTMPVLLDVESRVVALYNPRVIMPYTVLIDRQGRIRHVHQGYSPGDEAIIEAEVQELLLASEVEKVRKWSLSVNESFLNRIFSDDEYVETVRDGRAGQIINRLNINLTTGGFIFGVRADADSDFSPIESEFSLAKRFVEFNTNNWSLRAGDYYYSVGRGQVLSVLKTFEKEGLEYIIDTTIDGGKVAFNLGQFYAEAYGGWIDRELSDQKDVVYGGIIGWKAKNFADFRLNLLGSQLKEQSDLDNKSVNMGSFSLDIPNISDKAKLYGEAVLLQKEKHYSGEIVNGHGIYLESGLFLGNFTLLFEFKDYLNLDFEYNRPPLMESEEVSVLANQFVKDAEDITAFRGRADYYIPSQSLLFWGRAAYFKDSPSKYPRDITHFYGGFELKFKETGWLTGLGGYRKEDTDSLVYFYTHGETLHYQFNLSYPLTSKFSLELDSQFKDFKGANLDYKERRSFLSLHYSQRWVLTFLFDRTTDPQVLFFSDKENWFGVQLEIKFRGANSIRIFYGAMKGGVKCSGGICKFFPPFEGFRLDANLRF